MVLGITNYRNEDILIEEIIKDMPLCYKKIIEKEFLI